MRDTRHISRSPISIQGRRGVLLPFVAAVAIAVTFTGCSKSEKSDTTTSTTSASSSSTSAAGASSTTSSGAATGDTKAFIDIQECENAGGSGTATGSIGNTGDQTTTYELEIEFRDMSSEKSLASGKVEVPSVAAGAESEWTVTASGLGSAEVSCHTLKLTGTPG